MSTLNTVSRRVVGVLPGRETGRPRALLRRGRRNLLPMAEDLEGRTLLSVGLDPTWGMGGLAAVVLPQNTSTTTYSDSFNTLALQNGQVVQAGTMTATPTSSSGASTTNLIVSRLTTSGTLDTTFGVGGTATIPLTMGGVAYTIDPNDTTAYVAVQSNGTIDVLESVIPTSSSTGNSEFMIVQLTSNGSVDPTFGTSGAEFIPFGTTASPDTNTSAAALAIGPTGKLVALGDTTLPSGDTVFAIAQVNTNGTLDTTFNGTGTTTVDFHLAPAGTEDDIANNLVVQPNGSIVVVGQGFLAPNSSGVSLSDAAVVRLTSSGALDTSFNGTGELTYTYNLGGSSQDTANSVSLEGTQIAIAGTTTQVSPTGSTTTSLPNDLTVTRLNTNGTFDTTFNGSGKLMLSLNQSGIAFDTAGTAITTLADNSLLIFGNASPFNSGSEASGALLVHVLSTGALDTNYGSNGVALLPVDGFNPSTEVVVQTDGKALFLAGDQAARTTAPVPAVTSTTITTVGTGKKAKATGVTITFNTAVNPTLALNVASYVVRLGKGKKAVKIRKKGGISYNATTQTLTINFATKMAFKKGFVVLITPGGIVGADGELLFNGAVTPIVISPPTT